LNLLGLVKLSVNSLARDMRSGTVRYWVDTKKFARGTKVHSCNPKSLWSCRKPPAREKACKACLSRNADVLQL
jgi:hypothetical protein